MVQVFLEETITIIDVDLNCKQMSVIKYRTEKREYLVMSWVGEHDSTVRSLHLRTYFLHRHL